jgi:hypothetical protein
MPAIYHTRETVAAGGLMSYGTQPMLLERSSHTQAASSKAKGPPICQSSNLPKSSWSSI